MVDPRDDPIRLVPSRYDEWRERFVVERDRIRDALSSGDLDGTVYRVEHVGSTAVPDLAAKDVVDLDVVVADEAVSDVSRAIVDALGGDRFENAPEWHPVFRLHGGQRFNDHVFARSSDGWKVSVATREVLRDRGDLRAAYERRKRDLVVEHDDLGPYSEGKTAFVERLLPAARDADLGLEFEVPDAP